MERPFRVSLLDLSTLLSHVHRGAQLEETVGFEDCDRTLLQLTKELSPKRAPIGLGEMESALWSCNLMDEAGLFESPSGETFEVFLRRILQYAPKDARDSYKFDKFFNLLRKKE